MKWGYRQIYITALVFALSCDKHLLAKSEVPKSEPPRSETIEVLPLIVRAKRQLKAPSPYAVEFAAQNLTINGAQSRDISEAIAASSGVMVQKAGGENAPPVFLVRGHDPIQTRYFIDGVPLTDAQFNQANLSWIDKNSVESIDIFPQGTPTFFGQDGLGGAINLRLKKIAELPTNSLATSFGSFAFFQLGAALGLRQRTVRADSYLDIRGSQEDFPYFDDNGTPFNPDDDFWAHRSHNQFRQITFLPHIELAKSASKEIRYFSLNAFTNRQVPGPTELPSPGKLDQVFHLSAVKVDALLSDKISTDSYLYFRVSDDTLHLLEPEFAAKHTLLTNIALGAKGSIQFPFLTDARDTQITTGLHWERHHMVADGMPSQTDRLQLPIGVNLSHNIIAKYLVITPGLFSSLYHYSPRQGSDVNAIEPPKPNEKTLFLFSPRVGMESNLSENFSLHASLGRYFRVPTMMELFGNPAGIMPNPNLFDEKSIGFDIGLATQFKKPVTHISALKASYIFSQNHVDNLISFIPNSQSTFVATNVGSSRLTSHELATEVDFAWLPVKLTSNLMFLLTENLTRNHQGKTLPFRPSSRLSIGASYEAGPWALGYSLTEFGPMFLDLGNIKHVASRWEHDMKLSWDSRNFGTFSSEVKNLFDSTIATMQYGAIPTTNYWSAFLGYPSPGRRFYIKWAYNL